MTAVLDRPRLTVLPTERDHAIGPATAPVTTQLAQLLGDDLRSAFRHFPFTQIHPHAGLAAEVPEAEGAQGRFTLELERHVHQPRVREDFVSGVRSGVNGTPTFFLNGVRHHGGWDLEPMLAAIRASV